MNNKNEKPSLVQDKTQIEQYKAAVGKFPTGVTVITTKYEEELYGFTANSFTSVSLDPYIVSFCLNKKSGCAEGFTAGKHFIISILASDQAEISNNFASHKANKFLDSKYFFSNKSNCPVIEGCLSYLECKKKNVFDCGDHYIFIGEVIDFEICNNQKPPLVYFAKSYTSI